MTNRIYFDNSMGAKPSDKAISAMLPFYTERWGNPSAPHQMGYEVLPAMEEAYKAIYKLIGANEADDFVFTSSGAEAINQAIWSGYHDITRATGKNHFLSSNVEEAPVLMSISRLEQMECVGTMIDADIHGMVTAERIADNITPRTAMVSLSWANGLTGVINPVAEIGRLCQERGIALHLDATHVLGKLFYDLEELNVSYLTFNGDHLHAPKGTGGLYIKSGVKCNPFIVGGIEQAGRRAGSVNVPGLVALGVASKEALDDRDYICTEVARLRNKLEHDLLKKYPEAIPFFQNQERLPHISVIGFPGISNEALLYQLNRRNLFASIGGGSFQQIGLVLAATGVDETLAHCSINFSLSRDTTEEQIERAVEIISDSAKRLRQSSAQLVISK